MPKIEMEEILLRQFSPERFPAKRVMERTKLLIVDDHEAFRAALRVLLKGEEAIEVVAEAADGQEALLMVAEHKPDIVLVDISMPKLGGIEATRAIKAQWPSVRVILLTTFDQIAQVRRGILAGADGYLLKDATRGLLIGALTAVANGAFVIEGGIWRKFVATLPE